MRIDEATLDTIRKTNPLADVLSHDYGREVKPHGPGRKRVLCVFHNETDASLVLDETTQRFKCYGCGAHGDVFTLIMKLENLTFPQAVEKLARRGGVALHGNNGTSHKEPAATPHKVEPGPGADFSAEWGACVAALTDKDAEKLVAWRGYSAEFFRWLRERELIGLHNGLVAFPVQDDGGAVIAIHYRIPPKTEDERARWAYWPEGVGVRPLVIGDVARADNVAAFESQWDLLAVADKMGVHCKGGVLGWVFVATRGADNAKLLARVLPKTVTVFAFAQNDPPGRKWLQAVANCAGVPVKHVATPEPHKDAADWCKAGVTLADLEAVIAAAVDVKPSNTALPVLEFLRPSELRDYRPPEGIVLVGDCHVVRSSVFVIGGAPGVGKSRAAVALAVAGATGADWFGLKLHARFRTMIVQNENGRFRLSREFADLDCIALEDFVRVCPPPPLGLAFDSVEFQSALRAAIADFQPDVIVVDPWNAVARDEKARDYLETFNAIRAVIPTGDNAPALGIVAHTRKPKGDERTTGRGLLNLLAGSYVLGSVPRTVFVMQSASDDPEDDRVVWTCCKNNDGELGQRTAWQRRNGLFAPVVDFGWTEFDNPSGTENHKVSVQEVAETIGAGNRVAYSRLAESVAEQRGVSERTAKEAIKRAAEAGVIRKGEGGLYEVA